MVILPHVAEDVKLLSRGMRERLQVRMTKIGDGAKGGVCRAVQKVRFFCGDGGPLPTVEWCAPILIIHICSS